MILLCAIKCCFWTVLLIFFQMKIVLVIANNYFYECADWLQQTLEVLYYDDRDLTAISSEEPIQEEQMGAK